MFFFTFSRLTTYVMMEIFKHFDERGTKRARKSEKKIESDLDYHVLELLQME